MRQHPIPQNVLEVEFKLFTRFTVKEFAYIATGVVIGGLFIYLWTENRLPAIVAFPSFAMFSGVGLILGLVPIQDQPADRILSNYIKAINKPTLRVWQGEEMKLRLKPREDAAKSGFVQIQKMAGKGTNLVDIEEQEKLKHIDKLMGETGLAPKQTTPAAQQSSQSTQKITTITKENLHNYIIPNMNIQLSGTINMILFNKSNQSISNATVLVKDDFGKPRMAIKSGAKGEVLTSKTLERGEYRIEITHNQYTFNKIKFIVDHAVYPVIKITSL